MGRLVKPRAGWKPAPGIIETEEQYEEIANRAGELVSKGRKRTPRKPSSCGYWSC